MILSGLCMAGRKIPAAFENPFDNVLIDVATFLNTYALAPAGVHPNAVTAASLVAGLVSAYFLYRSWFVAAGGMYMLAYFFDCVDGNLARMTRQETALGDALDHLGDVVKIAAVGAVYVWHPLIPLLLKIVFVGGSVLLLGAALVHLSCQEVRAVRGTMRSAFLDVVGRCVVDIRVSRWLGSGTFVLFQTAMIVALHRLAHRVHDVPLYV